MISTPPSSSSTPLGQAIHPGSIDAGLSALWQQEKTATRASLMNLAIFSETPGSLETNTQLVQPLTFEHACRVLLIEANGMETRSGPGAPTNAWITAHCSLDTEGRKSVCCEQIAFHMSRFSPAGLTNLLFANLESDLPLILWWQAPMSDHFDPRIHSRIDRLIIDSSQWNDPHRSFEHLLAVLKNGPGSFVVHDLSYTRTFHLRLAIAAAFEEPRATALLPSLESIHIHHAPGHATTARLLGGWMLERLHGAKSHPPAVHLTESDAFAWPISRVAFRAGDTEVLLERTESGCYRGTIGKTEKLRLLVADPIELSDLLIDQLGRGGNNGAYVRVLKRSQSLLRTQRFRKIGG